MLLDDVEPPDDVSLEEGVSDKFKTSTYDYASEIRKSKFRNGFGYKIWKTDLCRKYAGFFLYNNLHGKGYYFISKEHNKLIYDGHLYCNALSGYGQVVHNNGDIFEGLFKSNRRFGPGVLTHPDGSQDVALWHGYSPVRLTVTVSADVIPQLGASVRGQMKILQYRNIIPVCGKYSDPARKLMDQLDPSTNIDSSRLYNAHVRNLNSIFFNRQVYDLAQFATEDCFIYVPLKKPAPAATNVEAEEDSEICICNDERCMHLNTLIAELEQELQYTQKTKQDALQKRDICDKCCARFEVTGEIDENELTKATKSFRRFSEQVMHLPSIRGEDPVPVRQVCVCDPKYMTYEELVRQIEELTADERFYRTAIDFLNTKLNQEIARLRNPMPEKRAKLLVTELIAWNNEARFTEMLQYCFRCRNLENNVNFNVKSLLIGDRNVFGCAGSMEMNAFKFLRYCAEGKAREVVGMLLSKDINPDLCDARGNTGLHFCVANDNNNIIRILNNSGANLNVLNDECLTPLLLCMLRYLADLYRVVDWEIAFLPEVLLSSPDLEEAINWRGHKSLIDISDLMYTPAWDTSDTCSSFSMCLKKHGNNKKNTHAEGYNERYIFSTEYIVKRPRDQTKREVISPKSDAVASTRYLQVERDENESLKTMTKTMTLLLNCGANPNIGEVPLSPVLLSIFTKNPGLVRSILKNKGDPNTVSRENLSALHILASIEWCREHTEICRLFLKYFCKPNKRCNVNHWADQDGKLRGLYNATHDGKGKTPLHIISMREDYTEENMIHICTMVTYLIEKGAAHDKLYLGHSPLSLAVLKGNIYLIKFLCTYVDLHQPLGERMGNILTVLALTRYRYVIPFHKCKEILSFLVSAGTNPFRKVYQHANAFDFLETDIPVPVKSRSPRVRAKLEAKTRKILKLLDSPSTKITKNCNLLSKEYLKKVAKEILLDRYRFQAVFFMYLMSEEAFWDDKCVQNLAKFLTVPSTLIMLKLIFQNELIAMTSFSTENALHILEYVQKYGAKVKGKKQKGKKKKAKKKKSDSSKSTTPKSSKNSKSKSKSSKSKSKSSKSESKSSKSSKSTNKTIKTLQPKPPTLAEQLNLLFEIEVPDQLIKNLIDTKMEKYRICYNCLKKDGKLLFNCPCCSQVWFCSEECNKMNNKKDAIHKCKSLFYNNLRKLHDAFTIRQLTPPRFGVHRLLLIVLRKLARLHRNLPEVLLKLGNVTNEELLTMEAHDILVDKHGKIVDPGQSVEVARIAVELKALDTKKGRKKNKQRKKGNRKGVVGFQKTSDKYKGRRKATKKLNNKF